MEWAVLPECTCVPCENERKRQTDEKKSLAQEFVADTLGKYASIVGGINPEGVLTMTENQGYEKDDVTIDTPLATVTISVKHKRPVFKPLVAGKGESYIDILDGILGVKCCCHQYSVFPPRRCLLCGC